VRKFYLKDPPLVLVLTLKRFNNNLSKNNAEVKVAPTLQLEGHCINPGPHHYELYAMIIHSGTARGGHYTACSRRGEGWVYFSDSNFKTIPWEKVRSSQPYILFYRRSTN
jgi:ubiquitin C-terminal hydrolase